MAKREEFVERLTMTIDGKEVDMTGAMTIKSVPRLKNTGRLAYSWIADFQVPREDLDALMRMFDPSPPEDRFVWASSLSRRSRQ